MLDRVLWGDSTVLSLWTKSYDVTIQIVLTHVAICFSEFEKMKLWHLVEICFWLNLAVKRLNEVCLHITYLFLKELATVSDVFLQALLPHESLHSLPEVVWRVFSPESTPLVIQQSLLPKKFIHLSFFKKTCLLFHFIANMFVFFKSIAWNLLSRIPYSVSVIPLFHVLVLPGVTGFAPDPSFPPVCNGGKQQIPSFLDFSLSSYQQDLNWISIHRKKQLSRIPTTESLLSPAISPTAASRP